MASVAGRRRRRRAIALSVAGVLALAGAVVAWSVVSAWQVRQELLAALPAGHELVSAVQAGDLDDARRALLELEAAAERARALTASPVWTVAEGAPWLGAHLAAVRVVSAELAGVASEALPPVLDALGEIDDQRDPLAIGAVREPLVEAAERLDAARTAVTAIDVAALVDPVADGVRQAQSALVAGADAVDALARASIAVPGLLGAEGPRDVLVMLQNSAEVRTGGGITGAFVQVRLEAGRAALVAQADSSRFAARQRALLPVPDATTELYGDVVGRFVQNATMTSDFALSAQLASAWWEEATGTAPDAVVAVDPLVLRALLQVAGPVTLPDGSSLDAENVVARLLSDPYRLLDPDAQTAYLQTVTGAVFGALVDRRDAVAWTRALAPAVAEGRVSVWSADPAEQEALAATAVGGMRARLDAAGGGAYGVYLNDATGGKMDGFLAVSIETGQAVCAGERLPEAVVRVTLRNDAPAGITAEPLSVTGGGLWGTAIGDIGTLVSVAAPPGSGFGGAWAEDGTVLSSANAVDADRPTTAVRVNVSPGESETVEFRFVVAPESAPAAVIHTPMISEVPVGAASGLVCRP